MAVDRQDREFRLLNNQLSQLSETFENVSRCDRVPDLER